MKTMYSPDQINAAHRLNDTCHELTSVLATEPADFGPVWEEWSENYLTAWRLHDDAEHAYTHAFPDPATRPETHTVLAAANTALVEVLRAHIIAAVTQIPPYTETGDHSVVIDCTCGQTIDGVLPDHIDSTTGSLQWVLADHIARALSARQ